MNAGDKAIKFTFVVDRRTLDAARGAIRELTSDIKTLVETMSRAHSGMQSIGGGGGLFGGITARAGQGSISPGQQQAMRGGSMLTQGIATDAKALAASTKVGTDAIRSLTSGMKTGIGEQVRVLSQLQSKIKEVEASLKSLKALNPANSYSLEDLAGGAKLENQLKSLRSQSASLQSSSGARVMPDGTVLAAPQASEPFSGGAVGRMSFMDRIRGFFGRGAGGGGGGGGGGGEGGDMQKYASQASSLLGGGRAGSMLAKAGAGGAIAAAILAATAYGMNKANESEQGTYSRMLELPMRQGRLGGRFGGSLGGLGMQIRGGDLAASIALERALGDQAPLMGTAGMREAREGRILDQAGLSTTPGNLIGRGTDVLGRAAARVKGGITGTGLDPINIRQSQAEFLRSQVSAQRAEEVAEMVRNELASNPKLTSFYNETFNNAFGDIGMARTGAIGLGRNKQGTNMSLAQFKSRALAHGYNPGEAAGARASLGGQAGRGLMGAGELMLSLGYGGLQGAGGIYGVGAQFGGGGSRGAMGLLNALQSGIGSGGMDVTAGGQLGGLVSGAMTGGGFFGANGHSLMQGMLSAGYTGTPGGDMRMARVLGSGMGEYGRNLGGSTDGLQQGINTMAAVGSGARGWYAQQMLMQTDPAQMLEMLRTGKVSGALSGLGVGIDQVRSYNSTRNQYAFSRFVDAEGSGTDVGKAVAGVKSAGGVNEYLKQFKTRGERSRQLELLGTARMLTEGGSLEANVGALAVGTIADMGLTPALRGRGAGAVGIKGTIAGEAAAHAARAEEQLGEFQADREEKLKVAISRMFNNSEQLAGTTKNLVQGAQDFDKALTAMTAAIMKNLQLIAPREAAELAKAAAELAKRQKVAAPSPTPKFRH